MVIEFDPAKSARNEVARGFGFEVAARIFLGRTVEVLDVRHDYGETRVRAVGETGGLLLAVVFTDRGDIRRIISARPANRKERALWLSSE